jgi:CheY-like chemotaxis protein
MLTTILLVDDDLDDQYIFNNALKVVDKSIVLSIAKDGVFAFEKLKVFKPDLIFLDMNMPRMNGVEFLTKIKTISPYNQIPVVVYSTHATSIERGKVTALGAKACIEKPILFEDTVDTLRNMISSFAPSFGKPS